MFQVPRNCEDEGGLFWDNSSGVFESKVEAKDWRHGFGLGFLG